MTRLQEAGAVEIEMRGRLGAFMVDRSIGRLWAVAENDRPLVIAFPLASSPRYEALATAIKQLLVRSGIEVFLVFIRGSRQRLQSLRDGRCHLVVMSAFAAGGLCSPDDAVIAEPPPLTYNTGHRVLTRLRRLSQLVSGSSSISTRLTSSSSPRWSSRARVFSCCRR